MPTWLELAENFGSQFYEGNESSDEMRADHVELLRLEVQDDGVGFDVATVEASYDQRGSLGMVNLRERAEMVNGVLRIDSVPGKGTRVAVTIPLTIEAAERLHHTGLES